MDLALQVAQLLVSMAMFVTLVWALIRMFASASEAKGARAEALAASRRAEESATTAAYHARDAATEIAKVSGAVATVIEQTNGMSHRLEQLAGAAGELRGRDEERGRQSGVQA